MVRERGASAPDAEHVLFLHQAITARFVEDNSGHWLYHCHVYSHQDGGMAGWYLVSP